MDVARGQLPERHDLHWLALRLFRGLGSSELPVVRTHGLSLWGYEVLRLITARPGLSQAEVADLLDLDKNKVVRVVDELETAGYAVRAPQPSDRRRYAVLVTSTGRAVASAAEE